MTTGNTDGAAPLPRLILISGMPATGKTTLAQLVGDALGWPLFTKDRFKELLFDVGQFNPASFNRAQSKVIGAQAVALLKDVAITLLESGANVILESNFLPDLGAMSLSPWAGGVAVRQVYCSVPPECFLERYQTRSEGNQRHPVHVDHLAFPELRARVGTDLHGPVPVDAPLLTVDTTDDYRPSLPEILAFCRS